MQFNDITKAIEVGWNRLWPPIVISIFIVLISYLIIPAYTKQLLSELILCIKVFGVKVDSFKNIIEPYGLVKLIPLIFMICMILLLYVIEKPLMSLIDMMPPQLKYSADRLISNIVSEQEKLALFRKYPFSKSFNDAYYTAMEDCQAQIDELPDNRLRMRLWLYNFFKLGILSALVVVIAVFINDRLSWKIFFRYIAVTSVCLLAWFISFIILLYEQEQQIHREWSVIRRILSENKSTLLGKDITPEEDKMLKRGSIERWWRLNYFNPYTITWLKKNLLGKNDDQM